MSCNLTPVTVELFQEEEGWGIRYSHLYKAGWSVTLRPSCKRPDRETARAEAFYHAACLGFAPSNGIKI